MARSLRIEYANSFHHVMSRGYLRQTILKDSEDFEYFLSQLTRIYKKYGCIMHAYCLMNNHFHLLLQNPMKNLAKAMQLLLMSYARYFIKKYKTRGKVFETRYLSPLIDTETYLTTVCRYIHQNPLGVISDDINDWEWSSYKYYLGLRDKPVFLETELLLNKFNNSLEEFEEFNLEQNDWTPCQERFSNTVLGSEKFIERITLEHINPSVDTNIKDSYQINKAYRNKVQEIKDYASKLKVDLKTQKLVLVHELELSGFGKNGRFSCSLKF